MATNLRLRSETETALREESERSGRSQQELIREALDRYLGLSQHETAARDSIENLIARGVLIAPREPLRQVDRPFTLPTGVTSTDLLDRDDRF
jgi:predicted DNA-binding protein